MISSDTVFAQSTVQGRSGIAVVRISGPASGRALRVLTGKSVEPRQASLRWLRDPVSGEGLDRALVLHFPAPASFTGEDVVELQVHGSVAVCCRILDVLSTIDGLRPAGPGEFTRRALMNGRVDLAQVEGLADLLAAETEMQRRQALRLMEGGLSRKAKDWRAGLVRALAHVEATIDFADEEVPEELPPLVRDTLALVAAEFEAELAMSRGAERLRDGFEVAIIGRPNVGKSTLINALAAREVALTSSIPGTTRDVIEVRMDIRGLPVTLLDTAGLREGAEAIESLGVARARHRAEAADLRVFVVDDAEDVLGLEVGCRVGDIVALAKADLRGKPEGLAVSGMSGQGLEDLVLRMAEVLGERVPALASVTRERQRQAIRDALDGAKSAMACVDVTHGDNILIAEHIRSTLRSLDVLVGKTDVEAVLDVIFASFCLGK
ncbi:MAG TPA: tRNA uridine-5-carboxymethylaminomethyl(34) synthesis GTPase MnmE [Amaricoccus sp.]|uniref:tRNA uridine-5-carboxymethylaminomethyl(34) synthesis GTPase MnmE n=1 Tax=Amaricoccus sp. TaxID=1872485 RepID=UPI002BE9F426|nr:tRNA uridine-5-carboxymethylaminomethyl(34) synthesis GTPase MnmE [Amaricoccus sp.]HMQ94566.1 tRNA uridine-5-carboxymethylaminomethyl(34) synthesis GTPase MnmE [Amaricoccus sp.]HMR50994.1 tRNA uridine-5-carboxymethylaminomethyl(34) synthesis GTPase MnmE [Amaricoccus sp.]HMR59329.1 tRNA uridine-5-carboxymethylaminomethyl(34) synthesis GTPase MnmE [Amaricoccus sp.]HMT97827.1 tRNA uridine-5-carboxymethylaminomethyl(34) synthesis GTPase MnmE [Amaricoccus sp.]